MAIANKVNEDMKVEMRRLRNEGIYVKDIAKKFNVTPITVSYWTNEEYRNNVKIYNNKWYKENYQNNKNELLPHIRERRNLFRAKHLELARKRQSNYRHRLRIKALNIVAKGKIECANCSCKDIRILEINHINGGGRKEHNSALRHKFYLAIIKGRRKIDDLNILCRVCNAAHYVKLKYGIDFEIKPKII